MEARPCRATQLISQTPTKGREWNMQDMPMATNLEDLTSSTTWSWQHTPRPTRLQVFITFRVWTLPAHAHSNSFGDLNHPPSQHGHPAVCPPHRPNMQSATSLQGSERHVRHDSQPSELWMASQVPCTLESAGQHIEQQSLASDVSAVRPVDSIRLQGNKKKGRSRKSTQSTARTTNDTQAADESNAGKRWEENELLILVAARKEDMLKYREASTQKQMEKADARWSAIFGCLCSVQSLQDKPSMQRSFRISYDRL